MNKIIWMLGLLFSFSLYAASSLEERMNKTFEFTAQGTGIDYRLYPVQAAAMFFIDENNLIGLKGGHYSSKHEQQTNLAVQLKHYTSNSFYLAGEVFYLNSTEDDGFLSGLFGSEIDYQTYTSMGIGLRIGNQWSWKNFTMGCDWVGIGKRVGTFKKDEGSPEDTTFTLLNFIIGASF